MKMVDHIVDFVRRLGDKPPYQTRRGSVLMEFLIVFPIYLVLFGGVFMIGDMLIKTSRLASADRTRALDVAAGKGANSNASWGWNAINGTKYFFLPNSIPEDTLSKEDYRYHAQGTGFKGPWTVTVGTKVKDEYRLAPWSRGWLAFAHSFFQNATGVEDELDADDKVMLPLLNKGTVEMYSKNKSNPKKYNYYTYRRTRDYTDSDLRELYRAMPNELKDAGRIVDAAGDDASWKRFVAGEPCPEVGDDESNARGTPPDLTSREYNRYPQFATWSD